MSLRPILLAAVLVLGATPVLAQELALVGVDGRTTTLTAADIAALPRVTVRFAGHGESHDYEGPLLIDVLAKVGAPIGEALRGPALADVVLVEAKDGYRVAFGLAEADPRTRPNRMILADRADGAPLSAKDGPFKVIVEGDLRPARSARMVARITLARFGEAGSTPGAPSHAH